MADFAKPTGILSIKEERRFTNPHVRFVRINGRVVPILNRKRIGQTFSRTGSTFVTAGAVLGIGGLGGRAIKRRREKKILANPRTARIFNAAKANAGMFKQARSAGAGIAGKRSAITKLAVGTFNIGSRILRNPLKAGAIAGTVGVGLKAIGFKLETESPFGADL